MKEDVIKAFYKKLETLNSLDDIKIVNNQCYNSFDFDKFTLYALFGYRQIQYGTIKIELSHPEYVELRAVVNDKIESLNNIFINEDYDEIKEILNT